MVKMIEDLRANRSLKKNSVLAQCSGYSNLGGIQSRDNPDIPQLQHLLIGSGFLIWILNYNRIFAKKNEGKLGAVTTTGNSAENDKGVLYRSADFTNTVWGIFLFSNWTELSPLFCHVPALISPSHTHYLQVLCACLPCFCLVW